MAPVTKPDISGKILNIVKGTLTGDTEAQAKANGVHVIPRGEASGEMPVVSDAGTSVGAIPLETLEEMTKRATLDDIKASIDRLTSVIAAQQIQQAQQTLHELRKLQGELAQEQARSQQSARTSAESTSPTTETPDSNDEER